MEVAKGSVDLLFRLFRRHRPLIHVFGRAEPELDHETFKEEQLDFREAEILETIKILQRINAGAGEKVAQQNTRKEGMGLHAWSGRLETDQVIVGGHSFGATAAVSV